MQPYRLTQTVAPTDEPIAVREVYEDHLRGYDFDTESAYVTRLVATARRDGERFTRRSWMPQTWRMSLDRFPLSYPNLTYPFVGSTAASHWEDNGAILLPRGPLIEVVSVGFIDGDGVSQTLAPTDYVLSDAGRENLPSRLTPAYGTIWPVTRWQTDAVQVTFRAGYLLSGGSPEEADVPEDLIHGLLLMVGELYKIRSESVAGVGVSISPAVIRARDLWAPHRLFL